MKNKNSRNALLNHFQLVGLLAVFFVLGMEASDGQDTAPKCHALIIGIGSYDPDQLNSISHIQADAGLLSRALGDSEEARKNLVLMTNQVGADDASVLPTLANIREQLQRTLDRADDRDVVVICFSGHALSTPDGKLLLCPFDADLEDQASLLSLGEIYDLLQQSRCEKKLLFLDAMRTNPFSEDCDQAIKARYQATLPKLPAVPDSTAVYFGCRVGQSISTGNRFLKCVATGIQGKAAGPDGSVTLADLELFIGQQFQGVAVAPKLQNNTAGLVTIVTHSLGDDEMDKIQKLIHGDRYDEALVIVNARLATHPTDAIALAQKSRLISYRAEQFRNFDSMKLAMDAANQAIQIAPNEPLPYIARSNAHRINREYEKAFADASTAIRCDPNCVMAHVISAFARHHLHDLEGMKREAKIAMEIDPEHPEARGIYVAYLFAKGDLDQGLQQLERAIAITPDMPGLHFLQGYGFEKKREHRAAIRSYTEAIKLNDQIPGYLCRRAISYANSGDFGAAHSDIAAAEKIDPTYFDIASARTMIQQSRSGYGHAEASIATGLRSNPDSPDLWQGRGFNHFNRREYSKALAAFQRVLKLNPGYAEAHMGIGMTKLEMGKLDDALVHLNRATRHKPHLDRAYFEKARVHMARKNYSAALAEIDKALKYQPNQTEYKRQRQQLMLAGASSQASPKRDAAKGAASPSANGRYSQLLKKLSVPADVQQYGAFHDYGWWNENAYAGYQNLPAGYWVYVYPHWYIWKSVSNSQASASH